MPPSITRSVLGSLARVKCSISSLPVRCFSSTPFLSTIGPENPKFIEVPKTQQPEAPPKVDIKGTLPPPRNLFPRRAGDKTSEEYFNSVATDPKAQRPTTNEHVAWKRRLAASRRKNIRVSLKILHRRKERQEFAVASRSRAKSVAREKLLATPQREDERLTNPTITTSNRTLQSGAVPDPHRDIRVAEKIARVEAKERAREGARRDALHTLYMHARSFITTEEQLDARIEEIFTETPHADSSRDQNIWAVLGSPPTVQEMLSSVTKTQREVVDFHAGPAATTGTRLRKIAEELTGGKMN